MTKTKTPPRTTLDRPVEIADHIYWVGAPEERSNLHCNPYLIVAGEKGVMIDAGSRPDFPQVMMKILQTGILPEQIIALIYQHPDPDLCGSMPNMVDICANPELRILSAPDNNVFISYYLERDKRGLLTPIERQDAAFRWDGRTLRFYRTPYAHSSGSFVTYDEKTGTLFTSDLFGSISGHWELFLDLKDECRQCRDYTGCAAGEDACPLPGILDFHRKVMPSGKALRHAMAVIGGLDVEVIAPQHGSVIANRRDIALLIERLGELDGVGIDGIA